jgi:hypothetical protein
VVVIVQCWAWTGFGIYLIRSGAIDIRILEYLGIRILEFGNIRIFEYSNIRIFGYWNIWILVCMDIGVFEYWYILTD